MNHIEVFTDGACLGNPGPGGWAALIRVGGTERLLSGSDPATTNNRMELMAAIAALESITAPGETRIAITTDSKYVQEGTKSWLARWRAMGWRTADGAPVKNQDLWRRLDAAARGKYVEWNWVKGHAGHPENTRVDRAAREQAKQMLVATA